MIVQRSLKHSNGILGDEKTFGELPENCMFLPSSEEFTDFKQGEHRIWMSDYSIIAVSALASQGWYRVLPAKTVFVMIQDSLT